MPLEVQVRSRQGEEIMSRSSSIVIQCTHRFTKKNMYSIMKCFTNKMQKRRGVQMVILAGWKDDESSEIFSTV